MIRGGGEPDQIGDWFFVFVYIELMVVLAMLLSLPEIVASMGFML